MNEHEEERLRYLYEEELSARLEENRRREDEALEASVEELRRVEDQRFYELAMQAARQGHLPENVDITRTIPLMTDATGVTRPVTEQTFAAWRQDVQERMVPPPIRGWNNHVVDDWVNNPSVTVDLTASVQDIMNRQLVLGQRWWHNAGHESLIITELPAYHNDGYATVVMESSRAIVYMYEEAILRDWTTTPPHAYSRTTGVNTSPAPRPAVPTRVERMKSFLPDTLVNKAMAAMDELFSDSKAVPKNYHNAVIALLEEAYTEGSMESSKNEDI